MPLYHVTFGRLLTFFSSFQLISVDQNCLRPFRFFSSVQQNSVGKYFGCFGNALKVSTCEATCIFFFGKRSDLSDSVTSPPVERLSQKDAVITQALTEKLQLFADLAESVIGPEDAASRTRLLLRGDAPDLQQGEALLKGAITEGRVMLLQKQKIPT